MKIIKYLAVGFSLGCVCTFLICRERATAIPSISYISKECVPAKDATIYDQLTALAIRDPEEDAIFDVNKRDFRPFGVAGPLIDVPGYSSPPKDVKIIAFTTDYARTDRSIRVNWLAGHYAMIYNAKLLQLVNSGNQQQAISTPVKSSEKHHN